jgi:chorismate mutase
MERSDAEREIDRIRDAIDRVDEVIVRLLNQRAKYAIEIGEIKGTLGLEQRSPKAMCSPKPPKGPLDAPPSRRLFERIIDESRRVEREAATEK